MRHRWLPLALCAGILLGSTATADGQVHRSRAPTATSIREAYLEVRESNDAALALYGGQGFKPVAVRPHYYRSPPEDALVLRSPIGLSQK